MRHFRRVEVSAAIICTLPERYTIRIFAEEERPWPERMRRSFSLLEPPCPPFAVVYVFHLLRLLICLVRLASPSPSHKERQRHMWSASPLRPFLCCSPSHSRLKLFLFCGRGHLIHLPQFVEIEIPRKVGTGGDLPRLGNSRAVRLRLLCRRKKATGAQAAKWARTSLPWKTCALHASTISASVAGRQRCFPSMTPVNVTAGIVGSLAG